jgi:surface antigen
MRKFMMILTAVSFLALTGCTDSGPKQTFGTLGGGALGGLAGSQIGSGSGRLVAVGVGTLLGAVAGSEIGKSLDRADRLAANNAAQQSFNAPVGEEIRWNNPDSGNRGSVVTTRDGHRSNGQYCREYQQKVVVGGKTENAYGTACRQPDGSWEVVK